MMKSKIAQQNRAAVDQSTAQPEQVDTQAGAGIPPSVPTNAPGQPTVQLSGAQIEEAKMLTAGKMKVYRKDRLFANDKEKSECLTEVLKNVRITDEAAYFSNTTKHAAPSQQLSQER